MKQLRALPQVLAVGLLGGALIGTLSIGMTIFAAAHLLASQLPPSPEWDAGNEWQGEWEEEQPVADPPAETPTDHTAAPDAFTPVQQRQMCMEFCATSGMTDCEMLCSYTDTVPLEDPFKNDDWGSESSEAWNLPGEFSSGQSAEPPSSQAPEYPIYTPPPSDVQSLQRTCPMADGTQTGDPLLCDVPTMRRMYGRGEISPPRSGIDAFSLKESGMKIFITLSHLLDLFPKESSTHRQIQQALVQVGTMNALYGNQQLSPAAVDALVIQLQNLLQPLAIAIERQHLAGNVQQESSQELLVPLIAVINVLPDVLGLVEQQGGNVQIAREAYELLALAREEAQDACVVQQADCTAAIKQMLPLLAVIREEVEPLMTEDIRLIASQAYQKELAGGMHGAAPNSGGLYLGE